MDHHDFAKIKRYTLIQFGGKMLSSKPNFICPSCKGIKFQCYKIGFWFLYPLCINPRFGLSYDLKLCHLNGLACHANKQSNTLQFYLNILITFARCQDTLWFSKGKKRKKKKTITFIRFNALFLCLCVSQTILPLFRTLDLVLANRWTR